MDMKLSFATLTTPGCSLSQITKKALLYGYDGVDIRVSYNLGELTMDSGTKEIRHTRRHFEDEGLIIPSLLSYTEKCPSPEKDVNAFKDWLRRHIEITELVGARSLRLFTHDVNVQPQRFPYTDFFAEALQRVMIDEKPSVQIVIQNHWLYSSAEEALRIVNQINLPAVGLVYSHDHCLISGEDATGIFDDIVKNTKQLYVADLVENNGQLISVLPGKGILPFYELYRSFLKSGFNGFVSFKWYRLYQPELEDSDTALLYFADFMRRFHPIAE